MRFSRTLLLASLPWATSVWAGEVHPFAAPAASAPAAAGGAAGIGQVTLALAVVLLAIFGLGWLMRRVRGFSRKGGAGIAVLAEIGLGTRERAVIVKVGGTRMLLGVAPGRVNLLQVLPADEPGSSPDVDGAPVAVEGSRPTFFALLQKSLGR